MVTTGFRNIYVAKYSNTGSTVSYTGFQKLARARGFSLDVGTSDDNSYYADDTLARLEKDLKKAQKEAARRGEVLSQARREAAGAV